MEKAIAILVLVLGLLCLVALSAPKVVVETAHSERSTRSTFSLEFAP